MRENDKSLHYLLKKKYQNFGSEDITDIKGQILAKVKFPLYSSDHLVDIQDLNSKSTFSIENHRGFNHRSYKLKDSSKNTLAKIKIGKTLLSGNKAYLESKMTQRKYLTFGNLKEWSYKIINKFSNQIVGKVFELKYSELKNLKNKEDQHFYCLKIDKFDEFPIIFLSFVICIHNLDYSGISNIGGLERRIARLRPFGPGKLK